jgi:hypothetical protein
MRMSYNISITEKAYSMKPSKGDYPKMKFEKNSFSSLTTFFDAIKEGHTFCYNMQDNDEPFKMSYKTESNFAYTQLVVVDIDNTTIEPSVFYAQSTLTPTYVYTSFSHAPQEGKIKYHVLYALDEKITSKAQFEQVYDAISTAIHTDFPSIELDDSMRSVAQCTNGTSSLLPNFEEYYNPNQLDTYSLSLFNLERQENNRKSNDKQNATDECPLKDINRKENRRYILSLNGQFEEDLKSMDLMDFLSKYSVLYEYREQSIAMFNEQHYEMLDNTNAELIFTFYTADLGYGKTCRVRRKIRQGEGKRCKTLIAHGLAFRVIFPNITDEHLVYCLLYDLYLNFDYADGKYDANRICEIAALCMKYDMKKYTSKHRNKYHVDTDWCRSQSIKPIAYAQHVRKLLTDEAIGELYDTNLSVRENTRILNENGIKVGKSRVGQFKKEHNL